MHGASLAPTKSAVARELPKMRRSFASRDMNRRQCASARLRENKDTEYMQLLREMSHALIDHSEDVESIMFGYSASAHVQRTKSRLDRS